MGTLESDFKQIKDLLKNDQGEKRLEKAGLKPHRRPLLSLKRLKKKKRKKELQLSDEKQETQP